MESARSSDISNVVIQTGLYDTEKVIAASHTFDMLRAVQAGYVVAVRVENGSPTGCAGL